MLSQGPDGSERNEQRNQLILFRGIRENITQFNVFKHKLFALTRGPGETGESLAG